VNFLKEMFAAIAGAFGWATQRSQVHNTEKMQAAAEAAAEVKAVSRVEKEVKRRDLDALRKDLAE
jgi:hypothetical protein